MNYKNCFVTLLIINISYINIISCSNGDTFFKSKSDGEYGGYIISITMIVLIVCLMCAFCYTLDWKCSDYSGTQVYNVRIV